MDRCSQQHYLHYGQMGKQWECPLPDVWVNTMWSVFREKGILTLTTTRTTPEDMALHRYCVVPLRSLEIRGPRSSESESQVAGAKGWAGRATL